MEYGKTQNQLTSSVPFDITKVAYFEKEKQIIAHKQTVDFVVIALLVHGNKTSVENTVTLKEVTPTQVNRWNVVSVAIEKKTANYINKVSIEASVIGASGEEILSEKKEDMQIAPSSMFSFQFIMKNK